jgi:cyclopropane fatty-acyl-phospholipid synthase-like methyltransferase
MSVAQQQIHAAPFDALAVRYDETFTSSKIGQAQRTAVWKELAKAFNPGDLTLEIGCGTGVDACFLAGRAVRVIACDSSSQMIDVTMRKVQEKGLQKLVTPLVLRAEDIASLPGTLPGTLSRKELFDGAFSNFGVLNCVGDLRRLALDLAALLKPGATALLCWMGPCCTWEMVWYLIHGQRDKAFRRVHRDGVTAKLADGAFVRVRYPSVKHLARTFAPEFRLKAVKGIGIAVPPSYVELWAQRHPRLLKLCERADSVMGRVPGIQLLADHVLVRLQRADTASV